VMQRKRYPVDLARAAISSIVFFPSEDHVE
jgi:hypothetical protein